MARTKSIHVDGEVDKIQKVERDELAELVVKSLNKSQTDGSKIAYFLDEEEDPSMVSDWVSTGSDLLDLAISNRKHGGLPVGRICEFHGEESTGKSLFAAHILANTQKMGGYAALIDTENAAAPEFWSAVGVDLKNLGYVQLFTVEEIFSKIEELIGIVRKDSAKRLVTIVVDSLSQASCATEMESEHGKDGYNTSKAIIISKACRKITGLIGKQRILVVFTNQLRYNMAAVGWQDKFMVPGGKAMAFASSVRIRLKNAGQLKIGKDRIIGNKCKAIVVKNRMGPPKKFVILEVMFNSGIQNLKSWLEFLKDNGYAKKFDNKYTINLPNENIKLDVNEFVNKINTDQKFKDDIYDIISNEFIMKYKDSNSQIQEDIEVDESSTNED